MTVVAITAKLLLYLIGLAQEEMAMYTMFANLLVVLVGTFFTVRQHRIISPDSNFNSEFKAGMRSAAIFALFMSVFVLVYYSYIDTHYFEKMIDSRIELAKMSMDENPDIKLEEVRKTGELFFTPRVHATITLFGLTATGAIYSFLLVLLTRKIYRLN